MMNKNKAGLVTGIYAAALHALWAIAVALGAGQTFMNWIFPMHFIDSIYTIVTFSIGTALMLVIAGFIGGYVMGWLFAALVNAVYKK